MTPLDQAIRAPLTVAEISAALPKIPLEWWERVIDDAYASAAVRIDSKEDAAQRQIAYRVMNQVTQIVRDQRYLSFKAQESPPV